MVMRNFKVLLFSLSFALFFAGCSTTTLDGNTDESGVFNSPSQAVQEETESDKSIRAETASPTKEDVLCARELALAGMTQVQIEKLAETIKAANLCLEQEYMYNNIFGKLEDPNSFYWNYFHQTGEIQIAWAIDEDLDKDAISEQENLTEAEFYAKYGTAVVATNHYDADAFISLLNTLKADVQNSDLKADLQYIMDETALAKETHIVEHLNNVYKKLHDLDYFLLRYGPEDVGKYVKDDSTVSKYYGTLLFYS